MLPMLPMPTNATDAVQQMASVLDSLLVSSELYQDTGWNLQYRRLPV